MSKKKHKKTSDNSRKSEVKPLSSPLWDKHPVLISLGIVLVLLVVFYYPVLFGGKTFTPPDGISAKCTGPFVNESLNRGVYPLWNPYTFGGMPSFASLHMAPYTDWLGLIFKGFDWLVGLVSEPSTFNRLALNYLLMGMMMFLFLRDRKVSKEAALMASVALIFAPPIVGFTVFSHNTKLLTSALIPIIFMLTYRVLDRRRWLDFCLLGIFTGMQFLRAHVQICYYTMMMVGLYWIYWLVGEIRRKTAAKTWVSATGMLGVGLLAGLAISSFLHLSVWEYSHYSIRGGSDSGLAFGYATDWSLPPLEILNFFNPSFLGFGGETYWGPMPFTDFPIYLGLVMTVLAGLALVLRRNRLTWFLAGIFVFSLLVAFGKYLPVLYGPMFKLLPLFNKFRVPSMINILMLFSASALSAFAVDGLMKLSESQDSEQQKSVKKYMLGAGAVVVLLFLVLLLAKSAYLGWAAQTGRMANAAYQAALSDGLRSVVIVAVLYGLIQILIRRPRLAKLLPLLLTVLVLVDVWPVGKRIVKKTLRPSREIPQYFAETPDVTFLKEQQKPYRILPVQDSRPANWFLYHFIESVSGYHAAKLKNYQQFIEKFTMSGLPRNYVQQTAQGLSFRNPATLSPEEIRAQAAYFKLLDIRYIITPLPLTQLDTAFVMVKAPAARGQSGVFAYKHSLGRLWFPRSWRQIIGRDVLLDYMASGDFDPGETALMTEDLGKEIGDVSQNSAVVESFDIHKIVVKADVREAGLLVLSEIYYPAGWKALVDGKESKIYNVDYLLRGLWLEPGEHHIEMVFEPAMFNSGLIISLVTFGLLLTGVVVLTVNEKRKKRDANSGQETAEA